MNIPQADVDKIISYIRMLAPEFSGVDDDTIKEYIEFVAPLIGRRVFGSLWTRAMALLICHKMKMAGLGDNTYGSLSESSRIASVSEGDSSVSFNAAQTPTNQQDAEYLMTIYGMQYVTLKYKRVMSIHIGGMRGWA